MDLQTDELKHRSKILMAGIVGGSLILSSLIFSLAFYRARQNNDALTVTGSAKKTVTSDIVKWRSGFSRAVPPAELVAGYAQMKSDEGKVLKFFKDSGFDEKQVTISAVLVEEPFKYSPGATQEYTLRQTLELQSMDLEKVTNLAKNVQGLVNQGVIFSTQSLEYYYSKLPELRIELLSAAVKDAQTRAGKIAESSGRRVGAIKSASLGVAQVLPVNSIEISDYGAYDTSSIEKEVMITVKAAFDLR